MLELKRIFAFPLPVVDLKQYIFAFSGGCSAHTGTGDGASGRAALSSAAGKSSDEVAVVLDLSSHMVVGYLKSAMGKLDSVSRMQAVATALRYRLL